MQRTNTAASIWYGFRSTLALNSAWLKRAKPPLMLEREVVGDVFGWVGGETDALARGMEQQRCKKFLNISFKLMLIYTINFYILLNFEFDWGSLRTCVDLRGCTARGFS